MGSDTNKLEISLPSSNLKTSSEKSPRLSDRPQILWEQGLPAMGALRLAKILLIGYIFIAAVTAA